MNIPIAWYKFAYIHMYHKQQPNVGKVTVYIPYIHPMGYWSPFTKFGFQLFYHLTLGMLKSINDVFFRQVGG